MHPNPAFRQSAPARNLAFARARGFGLLSVNGAEGPLASHVPFLLSEDGRQAELHLVRSNPIARALEAPLPALLAVSGPDGYVSPDWYGLGLDQVPTWNYVAVHLRGRIEALPHETMRAHLDRVSNWFEALLPKAPWRTEKMPEDALARMMRQIVPCRLAIERINGTWKLNQNKPEAARLRAAEAMEGAGAGMEKAALARLMREEAP
jgi:transcriptional regulator